MNTTLKFILFTAVCISLSLQVCCEFSFGEKQEPILTAVANPGVKSEKNSSPTVLSKVMTEDLTDKGWMKKPTAVFEGTQKVKEFIASRPQADVFEKFSISAVTQIPYYNDVNSEKTVTLTFYHTETPFDAFSIFSILRQGEMKEYAYGEREMIITETSSIFWEGPFLIRVEVLNMGKDTKDILYGVSKGISYKLYGLIGTFSDPDITGLFPMYQKVPHSAMRVLDDPFQLPRTGTCMKAEYSRPSGKTTLYVISDPAPEKIRDYRNLLLSKLYINPQASLLATVRNRKKESCIWVNSPEYGIVEIALKHNVLAVQTNLGAFVKDVKRVPGLKEIAVSETTHRNYNAGVDLNTYKDMLIISRPDSDSNTIIMTGITDEVMREVTVPASKKD